MADLSCIILAGLKTASAITISPAVGIADTMTTQVVSFVNLLIE